MVVKKNGLVLEKDLVKTIEVIAVSFPKVCAWCKKTYGISNIEGSSTICPSCYKKAIETHFNTPKNTK